MQDNTEDGWTMSAVHFVYLLSEIPLAWSVLSFLWILIRYKSAKCRACIFTNWVLPRPSHLQITDSLCTPMPLMLVPSQAAWYQNDTPHAFNVYLVPGTLPDTLSYFSLTTIQWGDITTPHITEGIIEVSASETSQLAVAELRSQLGQSHLEALP